MAAYHLSEEDPIFLEKAQDLGNRMLPVFETPKGLPLSSVNLQRQEGVSDRDNNGLVSTAEAATLQLEFRYLSHLTGEDIYWEKVEEVRLWLFQFVPLYELRQVMAVLKAAELRHGLVPIFVEYVVIVDPANAILISASHRQPGKWSLPNGIHTPWFSRRFILRIPTVSLPDNLAFVRIADPLPAENSIFKL